MTSPYEKAARKAGFVQSDAAHGAIGLPRDIDAGRYDATFETWQEACKAHGIRVTASSDPRRR